jgi:hypothetical protein
VLYFPFSETTPATARAFLRPARALSHRLSTRFVLLGVLLITRFGIWLHEVDALSIVAMQRPFATDQQSLAISQKLFAVDQQLTGFDRRATTIDQ